MKNRLRKIVHPAGRWAGVRLQVISSQSPFKFATYNSRTADQGAVFIQVKNC